LTVSSADFYENEAEFFNHSKYQYWLEISPEDASIISVRTIEGHGRAKRMLQLDETVR
jgi:hypothetical protein